MEDCLVHLRWIYTEVNFEELYEDCALVNELDCFLGRKHFTRVTTVDTGCGWGDALYQREMF